MLSVKNAQAEDIAIRRQLANELCLTIEESANALRGHVAYSSLLLPIDERLKVSLCAITLLHLNILSLYLEVH